MLTIRLFILLLAITVFPTLPSPFFIRLSRLTLFYSAAITYTISDVPSSNSLRIYSGLFQRSSLNRGIEFFLFIIGGLILLCHQDLNVSSFFSIGDQTNSLSDYREFNRTLKNSMNSQIEKKNQRNDQIFSVLSSIKKPYSFIKKQNNLLTIKEYSLIILFTTIGASFLISRRDLVSIYLSLELQSFAVYILASIYRNSESRTSRGLKYFLLGAISSAFILLGCRFIYGYSGLTHWNRLHSFFSVPTFFNISRSSIDSNNIERLLDRIKGSLGLFFIFTGLMFKIRAAPFHQWAPDVYDGVPTIVTTWLTIIPKISILVFLLELYGTFASPLYDSWSIRDGSAIMMEGMDIRVTRRSDHYSTIYSAYRINADGINHMISFISVAISIITLKTLLLISAFLSLVIGAVIALSQTRIKRLLAYSTINHVGFLLLALRIIRSPIQGSDYFKLQEETRLSFLFYLIQYTLTNLNTFIILLAFGYFSIYYFIFKNLKRDSRRDNKKDQFSIINLIKDRKNNPDIQYIKQLQGNTHFLLIASFAICLFSIRGIPPLLGFFGKYLVLSSLIQNGYFFLAITAIITSVISAAYYLRMISVIYFTKEDVVIDNLKTDVSSQNFAQPITSIHRLIISTLTIILVLFWLCPNLILNSVTLIALHFVN
jgi:NADH-ubiquinone oxidoreductase chain 2